MMMSLRNKEAILKKHSLQQLTNKLKSTKVTTNLRKRIGDISGTIKKTLKGIVPSSDIVLKCLNSSLSWLESFLRADSNEVRNLPENLTVTKLVALASRVQNEFCVDVGDLCVNLDESPVIINSLLWHFPIMHVSKKGKSVLVDVHELLLDGDSFLHILSSDVDDDDTVNDSKFQNEKVHNLLLIQEIRSDVHLGM